MKINFAKVPEADIDMFGEYTLFGPDENGEFYYNYVEFGTNSGGTEEVSIVDGCQRYMPISMECLPELILALKECYRLYSKLQKAVVLQDLVESDTEAYVTEYYTVEYPESTYGY